MTELPVSSAVNDQLTPQDAGRPGEVPAGYAELLTDIKQRIRTAQVRAARAANTEVLRLYWSIGHDILARQQHDGWGSSVVERLSRDLRAAFPGQQGWSPSNLRYMRRVAQAWPTEDEFLHHVGGDLPWRHITVLLDRLSTRDDRDWYAARAVAEGWKRNVLEHFIQVDTSPVSVRCSRAWSCQAARPFTGGQLAITVVQTAPDGTTTTPAQAQVTVPVGAATGGALPEQTKDGPGWSLVGFVLFAALALGGVALRRRQAGVGW